MAVLPVITALGGISPAGRSSCQHGFNRLIFEALSQTQQQATLKALAALTGQTDREALLTNTLVRRLEKNLFDSSAMPFNLPGQSEQLLSLNVRNLDLPDSLPAGWRVEHIDDKHSRILLPTDNTLFAPASIPSRVQAAGQLPSGFDPAGLYASRNHPRGLQMAIYGASDCLGMAGIAWERIRQSVAPDQVAVYASAAMSNLDDAGLGGMLRNPSIGKRVTSKQCPLGLGQMAADFINAYVLGSVGRTGGMLGTCATFLYNLSLGVQDIRQGKARVVMVGTAEAPLLAEVFQGYTAMGALAEDDALRKLDGKGATPDWRRACRPFAENCGFTLAESAQFVLLMDDLLALELGADILAAVPDVFVHADGIKKSIASPGVGNYLTVAKAAGLAQHLLGEHGLRHHTFVAAHGTGTPKNRVTESHILNEVARAFAIEHWPVTAIKSQLGHSLGSAGGDQLMTALGSFQTGILPGITTMDAVADDVQQSQLLFSQQHSEQPAMQAALLNAKGFGGNNATGLLLSPDCAVKLLARKHGSHQMTAWQQRREQTLSQRADYDSRSLDKTTNPIYRYGEPEVSEASLAVSTGSLQLPGWELPVSLDFEGSFDSYLDGE